MGTVIAAARTPSARARKEVDVVTMLAPEQHTPEQRAAPEKPARKTWLIALVAVALLAACGAGVWAIASRNSGSEPAMTKVIKDYTKAMNAYDLPAMAALEAPDMTFRAMTVNGSTQTGPYTGDAYHRFMEGVFQYKPVWELKSPVITNGGSQASVMSYMHGEVAVQSLTGTLVFAFTTVDGQPRISQMSWIVPS